MQGVIAIASLHFNDMIRRGSVWMVMIFGLLMILASRWLALWALGEELQLFQEFSLSAMTLTLVLVLSFAAVPTKKRRAVLSAERALFTTSISSTSYLAGKAMALGLVATLSLLLSTLAYILALWLFWLQEPTIFAFSRFTNFDKELARSWFPLFALLTLAWLLAGFVILASTKGRLLVCISSLFAFLIIGTLLPNWGADNGAFGRAIAWLLPDLRLVVAKKTFAAGRHGIGEYLGLVIQGLGYGSFFVLVAALYRRELEQA